VELFRKKDSRFCWYDFKLRGKRYRRSTKEKWHFHVGPFTGAGAAVSERVDLTTTRYTGGRTRLGIGHPAH